MPDVVSIARGGDTHSARESRAAGPFRPSERAYDETVFRRLLWTEWKRAARVEQSLFLVLVRVSRYPQMSLMTMKLPTLISTRVFAALKQATRDVDFTGWYRDGRLAAAVLAQADGPPDADARERIRQRVAEALDQHLPTFVVRGLRVKVVEVSTERRSFAR